MSFIFLDAEKPTRRFFSSHLKTQDIRNIGMLLLFRNANIEWKTQIDTNAHTTYKMLEYNFLSNQCKTCTAVRHFVGDILLSSRIFYVDSWLFFRLFSCWLQKPLNHHGHGAVLLLTTFSVAFCVCVYRFPSMPFPRQLDRFYGFWLKYSLQHCLCIYTNASFDVVLLLLAFCLSLCT